MNSSELDLFLKDVMSIRVLRVGGASAGILGSSGIDNDIVINLKKSALGFAAEYRKAEAEAAELERLSHDIDGFLQTLQLTNTISEERADKLIEILQGLLEQRIK